LIIEGADAVEAGPDEATSPAEPGKRDALLQGVIEYLAKNGTSRATFRSLATALGISSYPLVYHFGNKAQLFDAVVGELERRQREIAEAAASAGIEGGTTVYWQWCVENPDLLRLDYELLLQAGRSTSSRQTVAYLAFGQWHKLWIDGLREAGMSEADAETSATIAVAASVGLQMDLITTGDVERTTAAFQAMVDGVLQAAVVTS